MLGALSDSPLGFLIVVGGMFLLFVGIVGTLAWSSRRTEVDLESTSDPRWAVLEVQELSGLPPRLSIQQLEQRLKSAGVGELAFSGGHIHGVIGGTPFTSFAGQGQYLVEVDAEKDSASTHGEAARILVGVRARFPYIVGDRSGCTRMYLERIRSAILSDDRR